MTIFSSPEAIQGMCVAKANSGMTTVGIVAVGGNATNPYGHTAIIGRIKGNVKFIRGFVPQGDSVPSGGSAVPGVWQNDIALASDPKAYSFEWKADKVDVENLQRFLENAAATMKWRYHFASIRETGDKLGLSKQLKSERVRNCAHNALHVLKYEGPANIRDDIERIKKRLSRPDAAKTAMYESIAGIASGKTKGVLQSELIAYLSDPRDAAYGYETHWGD